MVRSQTKFYILKHYPNGTTTIEDARAYAGLMGISGSAMVEMGKGPVKVTANGTRLYFSTPRDRLRISGAAR